MTDAPERIWIDAWGGNWSPVEGGTQGIKYVRASDYDALAAKLAEVEAMNKNQTAMLRQADKRGDEFCEKMCGFPEQYLTELAIGAIDCIALGECLAPKSCLGVTPADFRAARESLGLTPPQAAAMLGYGDRSRISEIQNDRRQPSAAVVRLLQAYLDGYRPADWPTPLAP